MMRNWIASLLRLPTEEQINALLQREQQLEIRVDKLEDENAALRAQVVKDRVEDVKGRLGGYAQRNKEELDGIISEITEILGAIEHLIDTVEVKGAVDRAKMLRQRLRNNLTRANKARKSIAA